MDQAEITNSTNPSTSRREFLRRTAVVAAAGAAAAIPAVALAADNPDAEIFRLSAEICRLCDRLDPLTERADALEEEWKSLVDVRALLLIDRARGDYKLTAWSRSRREHGVEQACEEQSDLSDEIGGFSTRLMELEAQTLQGLAAQALAAKRFDLSQCWVASDEDADWDHFVTRRLLDRIIAFAA